MLLVSVMINIVADAGNRYISRNTDNGILYFLEPIKLKHTVGIKSFEYDLSYVAPSDSAFLNFSIRSKVACKPENITILYPDNSSYLCDKNEILFIDTFSSGFDIRVSLHIPISIFRKALQYDAPPVFNFTLCGKEATATYKQNTWRSEKKELTQIFNVIGVIYE